MRKNYHTSEIVNRHDRLGLYTLYAFVIIAMLMLWGFSAERTPDIEAGQVIAVSDYDKATGTYTYIVKTEHWEVGAKRRRRYTVGTYATVKKVGIGYEVHIGDSVSIIGLH